MPRFQTLPEALQHWAQEKPHSPAFIFRDKNQQRSVVTWATFYTLSGRFAADLRGKGIARGDLVVNTLPNSPERAVCEAGIWMSGAASVNGQCLMTDGSDLLNTLSVSRAPTLLVDPDVTDSPWNVLKNHVQVEEDGQHVTSSRLPWLKRVIFVPRVENEGPGDFIGRLKVQEEWFVSQDVQPDDGFSVFTTSGSTGFSKLVVRTQGSFINYCQSAGIVKTSYGEELQLNISPMGWVGGLILFSVVYGATRVCCDMRAGVPDDMAQFLWACIQEEKCKTGNLPPTLITQLAKIAENETFKRESEKPTWKMETVLLGGCPIHKTIIKAAFKIAHNVVNTYGATEFGDLTFLMLTDVSQDFTDHDTGLPLADVDVKIVDMKDESKLCAPGQTGLTLVKGPSMMKGYLNNPKATAEAFTDDGFFRTGDLGRLNEQGHLIVDGRGSDAIMRGPYIFYPSWIEKRLRNCPGVRDVVVVGVPDPNLGEELCACVVPESEDLSTDQVREFAEGIFVSRDDPLSACPRFFVKVESFPLTGSGKVQRKVVKLQASQQLGLVPMSF